MLSGLAPRTAAGDGTPTASAGTSWRAWLPVGLVIVTLVALLAVPILVSRRAAAIREEVTEVSDPARLLVPSALAGAALLLAADIAVRVIPSTTDIKVGVLTALIGVPFFLYLIVRERRALGGGLA